MSDYLAFKKGIELREQTLRHAVEKLAQEKLVDAHQSELWLAHLDLVRSALQESLVRIAVAGSVKSGKSTLINALLGDDLLKRGAGIITSFITRIRSTDVRGGWIEFKSWDEIHQEINAAVAMLPLGENEALSKKTWDLRKSSHREALHKKLAAAQRELQSHRGALNAHFILLHAYLDGFSKVRDLVRDRPQRLVFDETSVNRHQDFVGVESHAVYLKDVEIHCPAPWIGNHVEIADCQGSDSPNPLHFALLQQYLLKSHLIVYVVSSRTGLREADLKLLDFIKTLRMTPQTLFVLNLDLDTHHGTKDIEASVERFAKELRWTIPSPQVFAFSSLYHLLATDPPQASSRDALRLQMWREDASATTALALGFDDFKRELAERVGGQRRRVLFSTGLGRLAMVAQTLTETCRTSGQLLSQNLQHLEEAAAHLQRRQEELVGTLSTLENAIGGLRENLKTELDKAVAAFFDLSSGQLVQETLRMVDSYPVDPAHAKDLANPRKILQQLHRFYMEFRQSLSVFLVDRVHVETVRFAKEQEEHLQRRLQDATQAFWSLFLSALEDYHRALESLGVPVQPMGAPPDAEWSQWKSITPPSFSGFVEDNALGRGVLLMKFGLGRLNRFLMSLKNRLGRKAHPESSEHPGDTFLEAVEVVKAESRAELIYAFRDYRQNFRYQYLHRLLDAALAQLLEAFQARARMALMDFRQLLQHGRMEEDKRHRAMKLLKETAHVAENQLLDIEELRQALSLEWLDQEATANRREGKLSG
ncbi:dynamin family protein [Desulfosoma caldarium]|uniref:Dynamin family protein n=1 Tax=Desulfosoma caldarium TaxID=610254 RepID=A0A3N1VFE2_9BACT|nr:dynamin family protein [Desulfosoma caldarium]ROR01593.1 dynamin family protein [Desulfosoma caldarium]